MFKLLANLFREETYIEQWKSKLNSPHSLSQSQMEELEKLKNLLIEYTKRRRLAYKIERLSAVDFKFTIDDIEMICVPVIGTGQDQRILVACIFDGKAHTFLGEFTMLRMFTPIFGAFSWE